MVIEHDLDVIKSSDWVIDLGLTEEMGEEQLSLRNPEKVAKTQASFTGEFLRPILNKVEPLTS